ncbi:DUF58 domain-containing protein [Nocardioides sp.]|uniref:DUF58 domain-containing protein n=1 Tax=Nocardioides sp. TaxID=35761 RepID=UPI00260BE95C|nr:DUF58 domain-containing protein [Nocardioides sp.]
MRRLRDALTLLTLRGCALLAAGIVLVIAAMLIDQPLLLSAGVLAVVLVVVAASSARVAPGQVRVTRLVPSPVVPLGASLAVTVHLQVEAKADLRWTETLSPSLGPAPELLTAVDGYHRLDYTVEPVRRGRIDLGPMEVRRSDPFGLAEKHWVVSGATPVIVTPATVPLATIGWGGSSSTSGDQQSRLFATGSAEDTTVREYRRGDDLRRVHWRSTARAGELMVRGEEQPWQAQATVMIDHRATAHRGEGAGSSFETAVSAAASVCVHLLARGFSVRLVTATLALTPPLTVPGPLLEALADIEPTDTAVADPHVLADTSALTIVVLGGAAPLPTEALRRARVGSGSTLALVVDSERWTGAEPPSAHHHPSAGTAEAVHRLRDAGWRASSVLRQEHAVSRAWMGLRSARG